jgi:hypothetical protein
MSLTVALWLHRLVSSRAAVALTRPVDRKPMEIEIERLPDYFWRALGFPPVRRPGAE